MQLADRQCQHKPAALDGDAITLLLSEIDQDWQLAADKQSIQREFKFKNYYETMAFVNVVAMIAHQQDHHPEMSVSYNRCRVDYSTHSVGGLSDYDFICAAKIDATLPL
ncbi:MAG: 4a-hydroxytetrahydrobiopterin dehydratase [Gammaproteobacteria bacterium]